MVPPGEGNPPVEPVSLVEGIEGTTTEDEGVTRIHNEDGQLLYKSEVGEGKAYEKAFELNDQGFVIKETGQDIASKRHKRWELNFEGHDEQGRAAKEHGQITEGVNVGAEWESEYEFLVLEDNTQVTIRRSTMLAKGASEKARDAGHFWIEVTEKDEDGTTRFARKSPDFQPNPKSKWSTLKSVQQGLVSLPE